MITALIILFITVIFSLYLGLYINFGFKSAHKQIIKYSNNAGEVYYKIKTNNFFNELLQDIIFYKEEDARFYFNNLVNKPKESYMTSYYGERVYRLDINGTIINYCPVTNTSYKSYYETDKGIYYSSAKTRTLETFYNDKLADIDKHKFVENVIADSKNNVIVQEKIKTAINNNDIYELRNIINEYKETVEISKKITDVLLNIK